MSNIVDRRKNDRQKQLVNRQKFIRRSKESLKESLKKHMGDRSVTDTERGGKIGIPGRGIDEPQLQHGKGERNIVAPSNPDATRGDRIPKPEEGGGGRPKDGSRDGDGMDEFVFTLTREEFLDLLFEDMELPELVKTNLKELVEYKRQRAGYSPYGVPANLDMSKTFMQALGRNIGVSAGFEAEIERLKQERKKTRSQKRRSEIDEEIERLEGLKNTVPFLDDVDLRYRQYVRNPQPTTKAAMFCLMDVSASMQEYEKDLAKRFFMLLYMFLERKYEKVDVIFVRHTHVAKEVTEEEFFYSQETGGTVVSEGLKVIADIIDQRYPTSDWNLYLCQCSDGDNVSGDNDEVRDVLEKRILPYLQYFAYIQVGHDFDGSMWGQFFTTSGLWETYEEMKNSNDRFNIKRVDSPKDIYPVFKELFGKDYD